MIKFPRGQICTKVFQTLSFAQRIGPVGVWAFFYTDLWGGATCYSSGELHTAGQVKEKEIWFAFVITPATYFTLTIARVDQLEWVASGECINSHPAPNDTKYNQKKKANNICT